MGRIKLIRASLDQRVTPAQFEKFLYVCDTLGLDPLLGQINGILRQNRQDGSTTLATQVGIDGARTLAARTGEYAGSDDPIFHVDESGKIISATVTVWRMVQGVRCPFSATAYWAEYADNTRMWVKMPHVMLGKCAEAICLRKAFPAELSGVYTDDEMDQAGPAISPSTGEIIQPPKPAPAAPQAPQQRPPGRLDASLAACDPKRENARWHTVVKDTFLADDEARHYFLESYTNGRTNSLTAFLADATPREAEDLLAAAVEAIMDSQGSPPKVVSEAASDDQLALYGELLKTAPPTLDLAPYDITPPLSVVDLREKYRRLQAAINGAPKPAPQDSIAVPS